MLMAHRNLQKPKEKCVFLLCGPCWEAQFRILCSIAYILEVLSNFRLVSDVTFLKKAFPVVRSHITQIRRAINICRIRLKHVMMIPSSCSRPFRIACFFFDSAALRRNTNRKLQGGGVLPQRAFNNKTQTVLRTKNYPRTRKKR